MTSPVVFYFIFSIFCVRRFPFVTSGMVDDTKHHCE